MNHLLNILHYCRNFKCFLSAILHPAIGLFLKASFNNRSTLGFNAMRQWHSRHLEPFTEAL